MTVFGGKTGPCAWALVRGKNTEAMADTFMANLEQTVNEVAAGGVILDVLHDVEMPSATQRRRIVEVIKSAPNVKLVAGHAIVLNSPMGRGLITAINWAVPPVFAEKLFPNPASALEWLTELNPAVDGRAVLTAMTKADAEFPHLRW